MSPDPNILIESYQKNRPNREEIIIKRRKNIAKIIALIVFILLIGWFFKDEIMKLFIRFNN